MLSTQATLTPPVSDKDHIEGPANARVTLVEYGDYECPYCGEAQQVVEELQQQLGNQMRYVFRNFPLTQVHPYALQAAEAAEAAGGQGKFWQMHDTLYANQQHLEMPYLMQYAQQIGLDMQQFRQDMENHTYLPKIQQDYESGLQSGVQGTPTFFINGQMYEGPTDPEALMRAMQQG